MLVRPEAPFVCVIHRWILIGNCGSPASAQMRCRSVFLHNPVSVQRVGYELGRGRDAIAFAPTIEAVPALR